MEKPTSTQEQHRLATDCQAFVDRANSLSEEQFAQRSDGKWSVADVMQHLYLSARPVARLMAGPRDILSQWGKPDALSKTYQEIAVTYQKILTTGVKAPAAVSPRPEDMQVAKPVIIERFTGVYQALMDAISQWPEHELDAYTMPHPVLGNLTVREMLYFISVHTQHHLRLVPNP